MKTQSAVERFEKFLLNDFDAKNKTIPNETHRWVFCADTYEDKHSDRAYDCACCLGYDGECSCVCHSRIKEITNFLLSEISLAQQQVLEDVKVWAKSCEKYQCSDLYSQPDDDELILLSDLLEYITTKKQ